MYPTIGRDLFAPCVALYSYGAYWNSFQIIHECIFEDQFRVLSKVFLFSWHFLWITVSYTICEEHVKLTRIEVMFHIKRSYYTGQRFAIHTSGYARVKIYNLHDS